MIFHEENLLSYTSEFALQSGINLSFEFENIYLMFEVVLYVDKPYTNDSFK
jgi:hypothetical protein